jgi:hypothetical protein
VRGPHPAAPSRDGGDQAAHAWGSGLRLATQRHFLAGGEETQKCRGGVGCPPLPVAPTLVWGRRPGMAPQHLDGAIRCYFPTGSTSLTMLAHEARPFAKRGAPPHLGWLKVDLPPIAPPSRVVTNGMFEMPMLDIDSECPLGRALHHGPLAPPRMGTAISMANAVSWWSWGLHR